MKIAILTQPLKYNYGGILQCYALQTVLEGMGHQVIVLNRRYPYPNTKLIFLRFGSLIKCIIRRYLINDKSIAIMSPWDEDYNIHRLPYDKEKGRIEITRFIKQHIHLTKSFHTSKELSKYFKRSDIDGIIVGSDQVWREIYAPCIEDYFLGFLSENDTRLKITYAASFGTADTPISVEHLKKCIPLSKRFSAISVREVSGVKIIKNTFERDAILVLDPTLLLSAEQYRFQMDLSKVGGLISYILDETNEKDQIIAYVAEYLNLEREELRINSSNKDQETICMPSVETWLSSFANANFVVTDSFHGCVFSIINHKQFIAIANRDRGLERFTSLLEAFGLIDRLIFNFEDFKNKTDLLAKPIDYDKVDDRLQYLRNKSIKYLNNNIFI